MSGSALCTHEQWLVMQDSDALHPHNKPFKQRSATLRSTSSWQKPAPAGQRTERSHVAEEHREDLCRSSHRCMAGCLHHTSSMRIQCAPLGHGSGRAAQGKGLGQPKIRDLGGAEALGDLPVEHVRGDAAQHDVGRLQVAVDDYVLPAPAQGSDLSSKPLLAL